MANDLTPVASKFDADVFVSELLSISGGAIAVLGIASAQILANEGAVQRAARSHGMTLHIIDCANASDAVQSAVRRALGAAQAAGHMDESLLHVAEALDAPHPDQAVRADAIGRAWTMLTRKMPMLTLVLNTSAASAADQQCIRHLAEHVFGDALAELVGDTSWEAPPGRFVLIGAEGVDFATRPLDFGAASLESVREYLNREDVLRRFAATTRGDLGRLDELVASLPSNAQHLALHRYRGLQAHEQAILEVLAVSGAPLDPAVLRAAVTELGASEYFTSALRAVDAAGLVSRSIGQGSVVVALDDPGFGEALRAELAGDRSTHIHRAVADATRAVRPDGAWTALATHYCAAGEIELALDYGVRAISQLRQRRQLTQIRELCESLIDSAGTVDATVIRREHAHNLFALGQFAEAAQQCDALGQLDVATALLRAKALARIGDVDHALESFDALLDQKLSEAERLDVTLARGDVAYTVGEHDAAIASLGDIVDWLLDSDLDPGPRDRALLAARNTLGKIALVQNEFDRAALHFDNNRALAVRWGWDDEVARAQANLGVVALHRDDHQEALDRLTTALQVSDTHGSLPRAYCLMNLAAVYQRRDQYGDALTYCLDALRCARRVGDDTAYSVAARNLATIYQDLGAYERALRITAHLAEDLEADEDTLAGGWNLLVRAQLYHEMGEHDAAAACYQRLRGVRLASVFAVEAGLRLAEIELASGNRQACRELLRGIELGERPIYHGLAGVLRAELATREDALVALELARTAHEILDEAGEKNGPIRARFAIATALESLQRTDEARDELERELARVRRVAANVPAEHQDSFWSKPLHRELVRRIQALDGDVPAECDTAKPQAVASADPPHDALWRARYADIVGEDPRLHHVFRLVDRVARSTATVLTYGESGTGKELVASALHRHSDRTSGPFVKVNCGAFVETLLLSELFGHEKGAFTGANERKIGRFERADGGTIFLDEIGEISPNTQVALLRVLQEGTFERVGGSEQIRTDVRVICATNRDLEEMVRRGEFRLDLYYRLKGVVIEMPALRARREDIGRLANHFALQIGTEDGRPRWFDSDALNFLARYTWPGNVRELQNFVRSIMLFVDGNVIGRDDVVEFQDFFVSGEIDPSLPEIDFDHILSRPIIDAGELETIEMARPLAAFADPADALAAEIVAQGRSLADIKRELERECIRRALLETDGNVTQAAALLQMKRPRLSQIINADEELSALKARLAG